MRVLNLSLACLPFALLACNNGKEDENLEPLPNNAPVADAGANLTQTADEPIELNGGASFDPDGDAISFTWAFDSVPDGSAFVVDTSEGDATEGEEDARRSASDFPGNGTSSPTTSFQADKAGTYVVKLVVTDALGMASAPDYVVLTVESGQLPVANAGTDQESNEGSLVSLDGSSSYDPLGRSLAYSWEFETVPRGSSITAPDSPTSAGSTFTPDTGGIYVLSLQVDNGLTSSSPDTVVVRVSSANPLAPEANAGEDQEVEDCTWLTLDGSGSFDPNHDPMTYEWSLQQAPTGSAASNDDFTDRAGVTTSFWPDISGDYTISLAVYDGELWSTPDLVTLTATERSFNTAPVVNIGAAQEAEAGEAECEESGYTYDCAECENVTLTIGADASITDPDGDPYTFLWEVDSGDATISNPTSLETNVVLEGAEPTEPGACEATEYIINLTATDCAGDSTTEQLSLSVSCCGIESTGS